MSKENQEITEMVEIEEEVEVTEEKKVPKGVIIAAVTAAGVGIVGGITWIFNKLKESRIDYVDVNDEEDYFEEEDSIEIEVSDE